MVDQINPTFLRFLRTDIDEALKTVAQKHGIVLEHGRGSYTATHATLKLEVALVVDSQAMTREVENWNRLATLYGFETEDFGKEFTTPDGTFKITGLNPKRSKYPVGAEHVRTGKRFWFRADHVLQALERKSTSSSD